jgi:hypothetical protein
MSFGDLVSEKDPLRERHIIDFIEACQQPTVVLPDSGKAIYYRQMYEKEFPGKTSGPYFLYVWFCYKNPDPGSVNMKRYGSFNDNRLNVASMSYRAFTQAYADPIAYTGKINIHYHSFFSTTIYHRFPVSLRSLLDRLPLVANSDYVTFTENNLVTVKCKPKLMEAQSHMLKDHKHEKDALIAQFEHTLVRSTHCLTVVESDTSDSHNIYVKLLSMLTESVGRDETNALIHCFSFPNREMNYQQITHWAMSRGMRHSRNISQESLILEDLIQGERCEVVNRTLDSNRCYDSGDYEVYRLKGDRVLEINVSSRRKRHEIQSALLSIYPELDKSIQDVYVDPMDADCSDIARLRATNSVAFDSMYCRKAPPRVQPIVIRASQVPGELTKGKMVLIYEGMYYTTKDRDKSGGQDYIGMINRFGDYDPRKRYNPIIRTYKKNHLLSKTFKELKAYLLRNSPYPTHGRISEKDILLPQNMSYLYVVDVINPPAEISAIHTKKMVVSNSSRVFSGELPDHVKSVLGVTDIRRILYNSPGTGLLDVCRVNPQEFLTYAKNNKYLYKDTQSLNEKTMEDNITSGYVDHRLYGKLLEEYTGCSLIVFSMDGLCPYRYSKLEKDKYVLLFLSSSGKYDSVVVAPEEEKKLRLQHIRDIVNSVEPLNVHESAVIHKRPIDYTLVSIKLMCYIARIAIQEGMQVKCEIVSESECERLVENVYSNCIYYECITKNLGARLIDELVVTRKSNCRIKRSVKWLRHMMPDMVADMSDNVVTIAGPVDVTKYSLWDMEIENCLYDSVNCYKIYQDEEVQQLRADI